MGQKKCSILSMLLLIGIGVPLYSDAAGSNQLKKIQHHRNETAGAGAALELGFLSLYVEHELTVQLLPQVSGDKKEKVFFCPGVIVSSETAQAIEQINATRGTLYKIHVEQVTLPLPGLKIVFSYDPNIVGVTYDFFDSIQHQKGVVFRLHDRLFLDQLKKRGAPVLRTAQRNPIVVIDPGHGGADFGAIGHNVHEKQVCLNIGMALAHELAQHGITTFMTRSDDIFLSLDARTTFANACGAHLFVSIHANYAANKETSGIEIFCQKNSLFRPQASMIMSQEAQCLQRTINTRCAVSERVAREIQRSLMVQLQENGNTPRDRGVKYAVSQVLLGTVMPAVLIEVGFLSHDREANLLVQGEYQQALARGMSAGIIHYFSLQNS